MEARAQFGVATGKQFPQTQALFANASAVGLTEPVVSMVRLSGWPEAAVEVATGAVSAVVMVVSALAAAA